MKKPTEAAIAAVKEARRRAAERGDKINILFVCLGNICRSPAAEGIARAKAEARGLEDKFEFDSAGFYGGHAGDLPDPRMRTAARERGYRLEHRSRTIRGYDFEDFDLIIGMDDRNMANLHAAAPSPEAEKKLIRMSDLTPAFPNADSVPDPYWEGAAGFQLVLDMLENGIDELLDLLSA